MPDTSSVAPAVHSTTAASHTYDAIVIGSGISGGWAAKELCEKGLKTLLLERGRDVVHLKDYPTATKNPWDFPHRGKMPDAFIKENPVLTKCYALSEASEHFFVKDHQHPYIQEAPFDWIRGYQVGGKSLLWARAEMHHITAEKIHFLPVHIPEVGHHGRRWLAAIIIFVFWPIIIGRKGSPVIVKSYVFAQ